MFSWIRSFFERSSVLHIRRHEVSSTPEAVELIRRFIDNNLNYAMEWDDFISWKNSNDEIEEIRNAIGDHERLLFSKNINDRKEYIRILKHICSMYE